MKSKLLIASAVLFGASIVSAAPAEAHSGYSDLWPLYGLTGLILYDAYNSHDHYRYHKPPYYDDYRGRYEHRRHYSRERWPDQRDRHHDRHHR